jgi:FSR family fosmidomycin resistance protein-like MFS transporter
MTVSTDLAYAARRSGDFRLIGSVSLAHCVSHFYMLTLPPLFAVIQHEYGVSYTELGLCFTVFNGASALLQTQAGFFVDRGSARMILVAGLLIEAAAFVIAASVHSFWVLVAMFAMMGVGNTVFHPADYSLLSHRVSPLRMSQAYSMHGFAGMLGSAAAPASILVMYDSFGWRGAFLGTAIIGAIASMIVLFLIEDEAPEPMPKPHVGAAPGADRALLLSAPILANFIFFLFLALASFGLQNFLVVGLGALHGTDPIAANTALSGNLLMSALGVLVGGWIASRTTRHRLLASLGLSVSIVATLLMANFDLSTALLVALMSFAGLCYGIVMPSRDLIVREVTPPGAFGKVFGFVTNGFNIAGIAAPLIFGALLDHGAARSFFYLTAAFAVASIVSVACVPRRRAAV